MKLIVIWHTSTNSWDVDLMLSVTMEPPNAWFHPREVSKNSNPINRTRKRLEPAPPLLTYCATFHGPFIIIEGQNSGASVPETAFPEPYLLTETENTIIDDILELLNKHGLTSHQSQNLLERLGRIIEMGQRVAKGTTH